jgi:hypothetical protein
MTRETKLTVDPRPPLAVGDKVKLRNGVRRWTVRGVTRAGRFVILTQPFNPQRTVLYTIVDFDWGIRGRDNYYGLGYETDNDVTAALHFFQHTEDDDPPDILNACDYRGMPCLGGAEVSHRSGNHIRLDIESINGRQTDVFGHLVGGESHLVQGR